MNRALPLALGLAACSGAVRTTTDDTDVVDTDIDTDTEPPPPLVTLYINEILASNDAAHSWTDADGNENFDDWLELYNPGDDAIDLEGYGLTDGGEPWRFPAGASIEAGGHLLVWCSDGAEGPGWHTDFAISRGGEVLTLSDPYDRLVDEVEMPEQQTDVATYRAPDGADTWAFGSGTPGEANPPE